MINFDALQSLVMRARERARTFFGRAAVNQSPIRPYFQWTDLPKRLRGKLVNTRQCIRAEARRKAFQWVSQNHGAEPRKARRNIARSIAKQHWRLWREQQVSA